MYSDPCRRRSTNWPENSDAALCVGPADTEWLKKREQSAALTTQFMRNIGKANSRSCNREFRWMRSIVLFELFMFRPIGDGRKRRHHSTGGSHHMSDSSPASLTATVQRMTRHT